MKTTIILRATAACAAHCALYPVAAFADGGEADSAIIVNGYTASDEAEQKAANTPGGTDVVRRLILIHQGKPPALPEDSQGLTFAVVDAFPSPSGRRKP